MKNNSHYTLSISDLLMGFLFVFILVLMKFIIDYDGKKRGLLRPFEERACLLERFKSEIEGKGIKAEIDKENGILELPEILCFRKSKYKLSKEQKKGLKEVRNIFSRAICYSNLQSGEMQKRWEQFYGGKFEKEKYCPNKKEKHCPKNPSDKNGLIDTVLIEGHADSTPIGRKFQNEGIATNLDLAMKRAQNVFEFLLQYKEATKENLKAEGNYLYALVNNQEKSLFGMTSYGNLRSSTQENDRPDPSKERCINIRFIMSQTDEIQKDLKNLNRKKSLKKSKREILKK